MGVHDILTCTSCESIDEIEVGDKGEGRAFRKESSRDDKFETIEIASRLGSKVKVKWLDSKHVGGGGWGRGTRSMLTRRRKATEMQSATGKCKARQLDLRNYYRRRRILRLDE